MTDLIFFEQISDIPLPIFNIEACKIWLQEAANNEGHILLRLNYIFCSDDYLLDLNKKYLGHSDYTDILTFPMSESPIEADIYISVDRVADNANNFGLPFNQELQRVIMHGLLHMCGHKDKTDQEAKKMRALEDYYLGLCEG